MPSPQLGLVLPNSVPGLAGFLEVFAREAEQAGFASLWATDHVVTTPGYDRFYDSDWLESLTALSYAAAVTTSISLGVGVLVAPYRNPVMAAKILANLDALSRGRAIVGVGTGWDRDEFRALGVEDVFQCRGTTTDEALDVMLACWRGGMVRYTGSHFAFGPVGFGPRSTQRPHPPLWIGGQGQRALARTAHYADRWHPHDLSPDEVDARGAVIDAAAGRRIPRSIRLHLRTADRAKFRAKATAYAEVGCDHIVVEFPGRSPRDTLHCGLSIADAL